MTSNLIVFDIGTTGARTIVFDVNGKEIVRAYEEYPITKQPAGISEHDPVIWWNAVKHTCNTVMKSNNITPDNIIGISATFHRATSTIISKSGEILHPALTWMDERGVTDIKDLQKEGGLRRTIPKLLWLKQSKPDLFDKAHKIIQTDSYIYNKLCGELVTDPSNGIFGILNMDTLDWDEKLAELYELPLDLWPKIRTPGEIIGELTSEAANELNVKKNLPIILGGGDQQCAALGLGVVNAGEAKATTGTGTFVDYIVDKPVQVLGDFPIFNLPHVIKGKWVIEGAIPGTGTALKWFKDNFSQFQVQKCLDSNTSIYDVLTSEAAEIQPGSEGLLFIPLYIFQKGTIHGLSLNHTRGHMVRAIMESAALSAQLYLSLLEGMGGKKTAELRVDGGAMNSTLWTQIFADVINKNILVPESKDGAAMGAAILGFYGCKQYSSINDAIAKMVRFAETKTPNKENNKIYKKLVRVFMPTLLEILDKKRITGNL